MNFTEEIQDEKTIKNTAVLQFVMDAEMESQICFNGSGCAFLFE